MINANIYLIAIPDTNPGSLQVAATILGGIQAPVFTFTRL